MYGVIVKTHTLQPKFTTCYVSTVSGLELSLSLYRYAMVASPAATPSETQVRALGGGYHGG